MLISQYLTNDSIYAILPTNGIVITIMETGGGGGGWWVWGREAHTIRMQLRVYFQANWRKFNLAVLELQGLRMMTMRRSRSRTTTTTTSTDTIQFKYVSASRINSISIATTASLVLICLSLTLSLYLRGWVSEWGCVISKAKMIQLLIVTISAIHLSKLVHYATHD